MVTLKVAKFNFLGSIVQDNGEIDDDIGNRIRVSWKKMEVISQVLCNKKIPIKLKGKVYLMVVGLTLLYGFEC